MSNYNPKEQISEHFKRYELECPHCHELPTKQFIILLEKLRSKVRVAIHPSSCYRCTTHNRNIGGHKHSAHKIKVSNAAYGAIDIKTGRYFNKFRWLIITTALKLGFNNIEVANLHTHLGRVPENHIQYNRIIWGESK